MKIDYTTKDIKALIPLADKWFSRFIRLRDSDENGFARCCTCGRKKHWLEMDCGHFVKRQHKATRFDERNCAAQCRHCNRMRNGEHQAHRLYIAIEHGEDIPALLKLKGKTPYTYTVAELAVLINKYKAIVTADLRFSGNPF